MVSCEAQKFLVFSTFKNSSLKRIEVNFMCTYEDSILQTLKREGRGNGNIIGGELFESALDGMYGIITMKSPHTTNVY
jgi:hypothetical protein